MFSTERVAVGVKLRDNQNSNHDCWPRARSANDGSKDESRMSGTSQGDDDERQLSSTAYNSQAASTLLSPTTLHASTPHSRFSAHSSAGTYTRLPLLETPLTLDLGKSLGASPASCVLLTNSPLNPVKSTTNPIPKFLGEPCPANVSTKQHVLNHFKPTPISNRKVPQI